jgi:hypothetical protein
METKNIVNILKEATKDILTEDTLKEIETAFNDTVNERVNIHVEKALTEQDSDYSNKLEKLLEAIDADHTVKLNKVVQAVDADRAKKLETVVEKYQTALNEEAGKFKTNLVDQISNYLDLYLEEKLPTKELQEAVNNKRALEVLNELRGTLSVDMALAKESIRDAVVDGKAKLDEAASQLEDANSKVISLTENLEKTKAILVLEQKLSSLSPEKKEYMKKMLHGKSEKFIAENFKYTLGLFEKTEEERLQNLKNEAVTETVSKEVDRPLIEESKQEAKSASREPAFGIYMSELGKY